MRDDRAYLEFIAENIDLIGYRLAGLAGTLDQDLFFNDLEKQDAALRRMEILAGAASHLSEELKARHPVIDWPKAAAFRNILAHAYVDLDLGRVWAAITDDLPALKQVVDQELAAPSD